MRARAVDRSQLSSFRRLLRDVRNPSRLRANPLATRISCADPERLADSIERALNVSLYRLPARLHAIVAGYDLARDSVSAVCKALALSRRQFYRDHRAALLQLMSFMIAPEEAPCNREAAFVDLPSAAPVIRSLAAGLWNVGAYEQAIDLYREQWQISNRADRQIESALDAAEIAVESGKTSEARTLLERVRAISSMGPSHVHPRLTAQHALVEGHLEESHPKRQEWYRTALATINTATNPDSDEWVIAALRARILHALSLSHDHQGDWIAAREASSHALQTINGSPLKDSPIGLFIRANHSMRDARQFGNVDLALETLWDCLGLALRNGWVPVIGDVAVQFINLNLMRQQYVQALAWRQWISSAGASRLTARTRNFLVVDSAHALTMLGRPERALAFLTEGSDEGLAFVGAREYWRADALRAGGNVRAAFILAAHALDQATAADSQKGRARCMRLLATCHHNLGHSHLARKTIQECLELSQQFVSPYDLLLSVVAARQLDKRYGRDEGHLAQLLRGRTQSAAFDPPATN
jgi:tetratricopeptide (TPR) repeat protein